jgi:hypothetical protein
VSVDYHDYSFAGIYSRHLRAGDRQKAGEQFATVMQALDEAFTRAEARSVEVLGYEYLYAINVYSSGESFNLCPADICQSTDGVELARGACPVDAPKNNLRVERADPDPEIIADVERIMRAADIEIGGVEYMIDDRDGQRYYYDINALSNFVADAPNVIGFDPWVNLVDYLEVRAGFVAEGAR